ncbi:MAG: hypothetical protein RRY40_00950 [Oscillospiraceae bacterium]
MSVSGFSDLSLYESRLNAINRVREAQEKSFNLIKESSNTASAVGDVIDQGFNQGFNQSQNQSQNQSPSQNQGFNQSQNQNQSYNQNQSQGRAQNPPTTGSSTISGILNSILPNRSGRGESKGEAQGSLKERLGKISQPLASLMEAYDIDSEKLIILMVMWVLFNEKADKTLLLALGYLLL